MDLGLTPSELEFRDELRTWLKANAPTKANLAVTAFESAAAFHQHLKDWRRKLFEGGYAGIAWPKEFGGRGATFIEQAIFQEELALADTPETATIGQSLVGPTIIAVGTEAQKKRYLPGILSGDEIWCQGFSEPNAGSDLASLQTKAVLDDDHFVSKWPKDLDQLCPFRRPVPAGCSHRYNGPQAQGNHLPVGRHEEPGYQRATLEDDVWGFGVQRDVLFQSSGAGGPRVRQSERRLERGHYGPEQRAANLGIGLYVAFKRNLEAVVEHARKLRRHGKPVIEDPVLRQKLAQAFVDLEVFRLNTTRALSTLNKTGMRRDRKARFRSCIGVN